MAGPSTRTFDQVMKATGNGRRATKYDLWFSSDLEERYYALEEEAGALREAERDAEREATDRGADGKPSQSRRMAGKRRTASKVVEEMEALLADHPESHYEVTLTALRDDEWQQLKSEHPPQGEDDESEVHVRSFRKPSIRACLTDPEPSDEHWSWLEDNLATGEWERLAIVVWNLNEGSRQRPTSALATSIRASSNVG